MPTLRDSNKAILAYEEFQRCTVTIILHNQSSFPHGEDLMKLIKSTQKMSCTFSYPLSLPQRISKRTPLQKSKNAELFLTRSFCQQRRTHKQISVQISVQINKVHINITDIIHSSYPVNPSVTTKIVQ